MSEKTYLIVPDDLFPPEPEPEMLDGACKAVVVLAYSLIGVVAVAFIWMFLYLSGVEDRPVTEMLLRSETIRSLSGFERTVEYVHILPLPLSRMWDAFLIGPVWIGIAVWLWLSFPGKRSAFAPMWWMGLVSGSLLTIGMETFVLGADTIALIMSPVILFMSLTCIWCRPGESVHAVDGAGIALGSTLPYALTYGVLPGALLLAVMVPAVLIAALVIAMHHAAWRMFFQMKGLYLTACAAACTWFRDRKHKKRRKRDSTPTAA